MQKKINFVLTLALSFCLLGFSQTVKAEDSSLDTLKEELRSQYKEHFSNYKALDDKSTDKAKDMRQKLVNMGIEAKKIRDLMKDIKSKSEVAGEEEIAELKEQLDSHVTVFKQDHGEFSNLYAEYSQPAEEPVLEVAEDMGDELVLEDGDRDVAEENIEPEKFEKIVIAEDMTNSEEEGEELDFESESDFE